MKSLNEFDVKETEDGKRYLLITESRVKTNQRVQITIFPEDSQNFLAAIQQMIGTIA